LYPADSPHGDNMYPWTPPVKGYRLPKTQEKFQQEYDAAITAFDAVLEEGKAAGVLTTEPREKPDAVKALQAAVDAADVPQVTSVAPVVEGARGTKLRAEAGEAAWGDKKVSKKVYQRIYTGLEQYLKYWWTQQPPMPERPENATVKTQHDLTGNGCHMIAETSPEYDAWQTADSAAHQTPEYTAWNDERTSIVELQGELITRYDPLTEGDLDGDDEGDEE